MVLGFVSEPVIAAVEGGGEPVGWQSGLGKTYSQVVGFIRRRSCSTADS
jgi:hypothetical protein